MGMLVEVIRKIDRPAEILLWLSTLAYGIAASDPWPFIVIGIGIGGWEGLKSFLRHHDSVHQPQGLP